MYDILSIAESELDGEEPIALEEAKLWLKIDGNDQDDEIKRLITSCRQAVELYTSCSLISKQVECVVKLCGEYFELPGGPVVEITSITQDGATVSGYSKIEGSFPKIYNLYGIYKIAYSAGYGVVPSRLKEAILNEIAYRNQNRGDQSKDVVFASPYLCEAVIHICHQFKRMTWL